MMGGMYTNNQVVDLAIALPKKLTMPAIGPAAIVPSYMTTLASLYLVVVDGTITPVFSGTADTFVATLGGGSAINTGGGTFLIRFPAGLLTPPWSFIGGTWTVFLSVDGGTPGFADYDTTQGQFQIGSIYEALCIASTKGYTSRAVNLQDSYLAVDTPNRLFAPFADPATGLPDVTGIGATAVIIPLATNNVRTATVNWVGAVNMWSVSPDFPIGPDAGPWLLVLTQTIGGVAQTQYDWFWWGAGVPVLAEKQADAAKGAAVDALTAANDANTAAGLAQDAAVNAENSSDAVLALSRGNNSFDGSTGILTVSNADTPPFPTLELWQCWQDVAKTTKSTSTSNINVTVRIP